MKHFLFICISLLFLSGCNPPVTPTVSPANPTLGSDKPILPTKPNPHAATKQQWLIAKNKWQQQANKHYIYTLQRSCFCPPESRKPMRVRVKEGTIVQVMLVPENITKPVTYQGARSVASLFALIESAITTNAASIKVTYDAQYGYPTNITIDKDARMADEEIYYKASGMRLL
jgi:hypothetical protein